MNGKRQGGLILEVDGVRLFDKWEKNKMTLEPKIWAWNSAAAQSREWQVLRQSSCTGALRRLWLWQNASHIRYMS